MNYEKTFFETLKLISTGEMKKSVDELNRSFGPLSESLNRINSEFVELNKNVKLSSDYLREISQMNRNAERLNNTLLVLTGISAFAAILEVCRILGIIK